MCVGFISRGFVLTISFNSRYVWEFGHFLLRDFVSKEPHDAMQLA
jgi:hypothetical protein